MEQIELSPDQREHLVRAMLQEQPRRKRKRAPVRLLLAAALACGVLTISVLALSPALREYLTQALGSFAPYSQELSGATAVDQKVKVRVVSAVTDRYRVKLYVELTDLTGNGLWTRIPDCRQKFKGRRGKTACGPGVWDMTRRPAPHCLS